MNSKLRDRNCIKSLATIQKPITDPGGSQGRVPESLGDAHRNVSMIKEENLTVYLKWLYQVGPLKG